MAEYVERDKVLLAVMNAGCTAKTVEVIMNTPTAEVEPVRPELRKAVKLLEKNYERGLNSDYVRNPVAWALYQTWKEMDGGADNG